MLPFFWHFSLPLSILNITPSGFLKETKNTLNGQVVMSFHLSIFFCIHRGYVVFFYTDLKYNLRVGLSAVSVNKVHYQIEILCIAALTLNIEKKKYTAKIIFHANVFIRALFSHWACGQIYGLLLQRKQWAVKGIARDNSFS